MIDSFRHKGLRRYYETGDTRGIQPAFAKRVRRILTVLDAATSPETFEGLPGMKLHPLKADLAGFWGVTVTGNWRIVFRFEDQRPTDVDYLDYH